LIQFHFLEAFHPWRIEQQDVAGTGKKFENSSKIIRKFIKNYSKSIIVRKFINYYLLSCSSLKTPGQHVSFIDKILKKNSPKKREKKLAILT
jgi:hypothetical protein